MRVFQAAFTSLAFISFFASCAGRDTTAPRTDIITVSFDASSAALVAGSTSNVGVTVTRPVGYSGPISLTSEGVPAGVKATLSPTTLQPAVNTSTLTLSADVGAPSGTGAVTVRATGTDIDAQTASIQITVGTDAIGGFTILASPNAITVSKGGSASSFITISRSGGYTGAVSLDVSGFPPSIFASVSPGTTSADAATLSINIGTTTPTGTYVGTISAQGANVPSQTTTVSVTVLAGI